VATEGLGGVARLLLELSGHLLAVQEALSRPEIQRLAGYYGRHRGCSEAYTWVENRAGSRYWYWYLKCPRRRPSSVYLGSSPEAHRALMEAARAVAGVQRALAGLNLGGLAGQLAEAARRLEKLEATTPAEAAQHPASTPRERRRPRRGAPAGQTPATQQENTHEENSGQDETEATSTSPASPQTPETTPHPKTTPGHTPRRQATPRRAQKTRRPADS
jgi:hypothetical protein